MKILTLALCVALAADASAGGFCIIGNGGCTDIATGEVRPNVPTPMPPGWQPAARPVADETAGQTRRMSQYPMERERHAVQAARPEPRMEQDAPRNAPGPTKQGILDIQTGETLLPTGAGYFRPSTGAYYARTGKGLVNSETGEYIPILGR